MRTYTVRALSAELDRLLNRSYPRLEVTGELAQCQVPSSGHAYLTLREEDAALSVVVWRDDWRRLDWRPQVGKRVLCRGRLGAYRGQGRYQLYANHVELAGEGKLEAQLKAIRARLQADGLLDPRRKRALPRVPRVIGLATSPTGAALQDFLRVSRERWPAARVLLAPCTVQGVDAAGSVVRALELLFDDGRADVVVVTRGGGSKSDLLAFQDEGLARWIATAPVPVVSAVGHEIDSTIADLVADAVAPTPSAAAVLVLPDAAATAQRIDEADAAMRAAMVRVLGARRTRMEALRARLRHPRHVLAQRGARTADLRARLVASAERRIERDRARHRALAGRLQALSPYGVLDRGYAIVRGPGGVVRGPEDVGSGDALSIRVARGAVDAVVR